MDSFFCAKSSDTGRQGETTELSAAEISSEEDVRAKGCLFYKEYHQQEVGQAYSNANEPFGKIKSYKTNLSSVLYIFYLYPPNKLTARRVEKCCL